MNGSRRRLVFLDIDGTYANHGQVPAAHVQAVRAARTAGHRVLLCTGRPAPMVPARILAAGFDGLVASAGAWVRVGDRLLADRRFPAAVAARTVQVLDDARAWYLLEGPDALYGRPGLDEVFRTRVARHVQPGGAAGGPSDLLAALQLTDDLAGRSFAKVTVVDAALPVSTLGTLVGPQVATVPSSVPDLDCGGELYLAGLTKAVGIATVCDHLGVDLADVVAIGDGMNDLEMIEVAGTGVAIEGAPPAVLAAADRVAAGPARAGLVDAFAGLGLT